MGGDQIKFEAQSNQDKGLHTGAMHFWKKKTYKTLISLTSRNMQTKIIFAYKKNKALEIQI